MAVTKVWIEQSDCISCGACEATCPEVFVADGSEYTVKPEANNAAYLAPLLDTIKEAINGCPVECIKTEE